MRSPKKQDCALLLWPLLKNAYKDRIYHDTILNILVSVCLPGVTFQIILKHVEPNHCYKHLNVLQMHSSLRFYVMF